MESHNQLMCTVKCMSPEYTKSNKHYVTMPLDSIFYAPDLEEAEDAYTFRSAYLSVIFPLVSYRLSVTGTLYYSTFCDFILDEFSKSYFATLVEHDDINSFELV